MSFEVLLPVSAQVRVTVKGEYEMARQPPHSFSRGKPLVSGYLYNPCVRNRHFRPSACFFSVALCSCVAGDETMHVEGLRRSSMVEGPLDSSAKMESYQVSSST